MRLAIEKCREGIRAGQSPFGCAIALEEKVIAVCHNTVRLTHDATAHAEVNAIRAAGAKLQSFDLSGAIVATTCEPCPMCMSALHWARVSTVYYGSTIADAASAGFSELMLPAKEVARSGGNRVALKEGLMADECKSLFEEWKKAHAAVPY